MTTAKTNLKLALPTNNNSTEYGSVQTNRSISTSPQRIRRPASSDSPMLMPYSPALSSRSIPGHNFPFQFQSPNRSSRSTKKDRVIFIHSHSDNSSHKRSLSVPKSRSPEHTLAMAMPKELVDIIAVDVVDDVGDPFDNDDRKISTLQAAFSIINIFLGLCLLSFPYALAQCSLSSVVPFLFICFALCYTGKLIVRCFNHTPQQNRTYPLVGRHAFGTKYGFLAEYLVALGIIGEIFGALCTNSIFLWNNIKYLFGDYLSMDQIVLICSGVLLPTCWMLDFSQLSINSLLGCVCKMFTALVIVCTFFIAGPTQTVEANTYEIFPQSATSFTIGIGIYIMSFAGHPCLPSIYAAMRHPEQFDRMLDLCFLAMAVSYSLIALFGYLQFGTETQVIITNNLMNNDNVSGSDTRGFLDIVNKILLSLVILGCYFQVSPLLCVLAEIPETQWLKINIINKYGTMKLRIFRTILFAVVTLIAYLLMDSLALVEAVTGSLGTMITSVICPALFWYVIKISFKEKQICTSHTSLLANQANQANKNKHNTHKQTSDLKSESDCLKPKPKHIFNCESLILWLYVIVGCVLAVVFLYQDLSLI